MRKETQNRRTGGNSLAEVNFGEVDLKEALLTHVIILPFTWLVSTFQMGLKRDLHSPCLPLGLLVTSASEMISFSLKGSYHSFLTDCPQLGKIEGRRRRGQPRTRWLDDTTDSVDVILSKLREMVNDKEASHAAVRGIGVGLNWATENNKDVTAHSLSQAGPESILGGPASSPPHALTPSRAILPTPVVLISLTTGDPQGYSSWLECFPKLCLALLMVLLDTLTQYPWTAQPILSRSELSFPLSAATQTFFISQFGEQSSVIQEVRSHAHNHLFIFS